MKNYTLFIILLLFALKVSAQYKNITIKNSTSSDLKIVQIDFCENSTIVFFQYNTNDSEGFGACADENFYIKDNLSLNKFFLLNSINLPICDKMHIFGKGNQIHNFALEFEKFPKSIGEFDIIENNEGGSNFYGVKIDTTIKENNFMNIQNFLINTSVKEYSYYYKDGHPVYYYKHKGLTIAVLLEYKNIYGKYYQANIVVQNLTGKDFNFDPNKISAKIHKKQIISDVRVLSYHEYMNIVKRQQAWGAFANALGESLSAINAGNSYITSQGIASGHLNSNSMIYENYGNKEFNINGTTSSSGIGTWNTTTKKYDATSAFIVQQKVKENVTNYQNQQYQITRSIGDGYMKLNTIMNGTEYIGYVNIEYIKNENFQLFIPINGTIYTFNWYW